MASRAQRERLREAVDLLKNDQRQAARRLLRDLIREDGDFEEAWLWMSVAVDSLHESTVCLDNALRVNPNNIYAAGALFRIRETDMEIERRVGRYRFYQGLAFSTFWVMALAFLYAVIASVMMR